MDRYYGIHHLLNGDENAKNTNMEGSLLRRTFPSFYTHHLPDCHVS